MLPSQSLGVSCTPHNKGCLHSNGPALRAAPAYLGLSQRSYLRQRLHGALTRRSGPLPTHSSANLQREPLATDTDDVADRPTAVLGILLALMWGSLCVTSTPPSGTPHCFAAVSLSQPQAQVAIDRRAHSTPDKVQPAAAKRFVTALARFTWALIDVPIRTVEYLLLGPHPLEPYRPQSSPTHASVAQEPTCLQAAAPTTSPDEPPAAQPASAADQAVADLVAAVQQAASQQSTLAPLDAPITPVATGPDAAPEQTSLRDRLAAAYSASVEDWLPALASHCKDLAAAPIELASSIRGNVMRYIPSDLPASAEHRAALVDLARLLSLAAGILTMHALATAVFVGKRNASRRAAAAQAANSSTPALASEHLLCDLPPPKCDLPPPKCDLPAKCDIPPAKCVIPPAKCDLPPPACALPHATNPSSFTQTGATASPTAPPTAASVQPAAPQLPPRKRKVRFAHPWSLWSLTQVPTFNPPPGDHLLEEVEEEAPPATTTKQQSGSGRRVRFLSPFTLWMLGQAPSLWKPPADHWITDVEDEAPEPPPAASEPPTPTVAAAAPHSPRTAAPPQQPAVPTLVQPGDKPAAHKPKKKRIHFVSPLALWGLALTNNFNPPPGDHLLVESDDDDEVQPAPTAATAVAEQPQPQPTGQPTPVADPDGQPAAAAAKTRVRKQFVSPWALWGLTMINHFNPPAGDHLLEEVEVVEAVAPAQPKTHFPSPWELWALSTVDSYIPPCGADLAVEDPTPPEPELGPAAAVSPLAPHQRAPGDGTTTQQAQPLEAVPVVVPAEAPPVSRTASSMLSLVGPQKVWQALYEQAQTTDHVAAPPRPSNSLSAAAAALVNAGCVCAPAGAATAAAPAPAAPADAAAGQQSEGSRVKAEDDELSAAFHALAESQKCKSTNAGAAATDSSSTRTRAVRDVSEAIQKLHERGYSINYLAVRRKGPVVAKRRFAGLKEMVRRGQGQDAAATSAAPAVPAADAAALGSCIAAAAQAHVQAPAAAAAAVGAGMAAEEVVSATKPDSGAEYVWVINGSVSARVRVQPDKPPVQPQESAEVASEAALKVAALNMDRVVPEAWTGPWTSNGVETEGGGGEPAVDWSCSTPFPTTDTPQAGEGMAAPATEAAAQAPEVPRPEFKTFMSPMHGKHEHPMAQLLQLATPSAAAADSAADTAVPAGSKVDEMEESKVGDTEEFQLYSQGGKMFVRYKRPSGNAAGSTPVSGGVSKATQTEPLGVSQDAVTEGIQVVAAAPDMPAAAPVEEDVALGAIVQSASPTLVEQVKELGLEQLVRGIENKQGSGSVLTTAPKEYQLYRQGGKMFVRYKKPEAEGSTPVSDAVSKATQTEPLDVSQGVSKVASTEFQDVSKVVSTGTMSEDGPVEVTITPPRTPQVARSAAGLFPLVKPRREYQMVLENGRMTVRYLAPRKTPEQESAVAATPAASAVDHSTQTEPLADVVDSSNGMSKVVSNGMSKVVIAREMVAEAEAEVAEQADAAGDGATRKFEFMAVNMLRKRPHKASVVAKERATLALMDALNPMGSATTTGGNGDAQATDSLVSAAAEADAERVAAGLDDNAEVHHLLRAVPVLHLPEAEVEIVAPQGSGLTRTLATNLSQEGRRRYQLVRQNGQMVVVLDQTANTAAVSKLEDDDNKRASGTRGVGFSPAPRVAAPATAVDAERVMGSRVVALGSSKPAWARQESGAHVPPRNPWADVRPRRRWRRNFSPTNE